jgi:diaminohydroxyphosphoribosylaminopyrimidine deaminase / 5-amino-6-(5-phosphoribosylamino)uracil reductase
VSFESQPTLADRPSVGPSVGPADTSADTSAHTSADSDDGLMALAIAAANGARRWTSPNPWVGAAVRTASGQTYVGATEPPPGRHAEIVAMDAARAGEGPDALLGATLATTLEPCSHHGRTPPCADAIVYAGVARVVVGIVDPDTNVAGRGLTRMRNAGIAIHGGVGAAEITQQLLPYLVHRRTGRPYAARTDAHVLRAESDAIIVGAGTVRADDPTLTVRHVEGRDPRRIVLGSAPAGAKIHPCLEYRGELPDLLDSLGADGVLQVLVEGGATVAHAFHTARLVDRYVLYLAPALLGGDNGIALFRGPGAATIDNLFRGTITSVRQLGDDLRVEMTGRSPL